MKKQIFYIHGGESFVEYKQFLERLHTKGIWDLPSTEGRRKWTDSLREDLGEDYEVFMPQMPNKQNARYEEWKIWFERHFEFLNNDIILMGYSLGAMFLSKYLSENKCPFRIKAVFIMAGVVNVDSFDDSDCGDFMVDLAQVDNIATQADKVYILHSTDDFLVPYEHALKFKEALPEAELITFEDKNHFLIEDFPELIALLREM